MPDIMRRWLPISILLAILVALAVIVFTAISQGRAKVVILPDGTHIELVGTQVGSKMFTTEKPWHKQARKILPLKWQRWIPAPISGGCGATTNALTVYFQVTPPPGVPPNN